MNHLAIYSTKAFGEDYIEMMLAGVKTVDSKFTYRRTAPYARLREGDVVYLKESSGPVRGRITIGAVVDSELSEPEDIMRYLSPVYRELGIIDEEHLMRVWRSHASKRFVCQWRILKPERAHHPVRVYKNDMRTWVPDYDPPEELLVAFS